MEKQNNKTKRKSRILVVNKCSKTQKTFLYDLVLIINFFAWRLNSRLQFLSREKSFPIFFCGEYFFLIKWLVAGIHPIKARFYTVLDGFQKFDLKADILNCFIFVFVLLFSVFSCCLVFFSSIILRGWSSMGWIYPKWIRNKREFRVGLFLLVFFFLRSKLFKRNQLQKNG